MEKIVKLKESPPEDHEIKDYLGEIFSNRFTGLYIAFLEREESKGYVIGMRTSKQLLDRVAEASFASLMQMSGVERFYQVCGTHKSTIITKYKPMENHFFSTTYFQTPKRPNQKLIEILSKQERYDFGGLVRWLCTPKEQFRWQYELVFRLDKDAEEGKPAQGSQGAADGSE